MKHLIRLILVVLAGLVIGSVVNMSLVMLGPQLIAPPAGADVTTMEGLKASLHLFEPRHFLFPFLAHALGTLVGALVATRLVGDRSARAAYVVGGFFMLGGIANCFMLPGPAWFNAVDVLLAYLPMAWLGHRLGARGKA